LAAEKESRESCSEGKTSEQKAAFLALMVSRMPTGKALPKEEITPPSSPRPADNSAGHLLLYANGRDRKAVDNKKPSLSLRTMADADLEEVSQ